MNCKYVVVALFWFHYFAVISLSFFFFF